MAAKSKGTESKGTEKKPGTSVATIAEELRKEAEAIASRISAPSGDLIRVTQDKKFVLPDGSKGDTVTGVIVDFVSGNFHHDRPYKKGEESPPACFALGTEQNDKLIPSGNSPKKQADSCHECPNNDWGSKGNGKACDNLRFLAIVEPGDGDDVPSEIRVLKVSPTAIKAFDSYVQTIKAQFNLPPIAVVTDIYFDPKLEYGSLRFGNPRPNPHMNQHFELRKAARERLLTEPDVSRYKEPVTTKPKRK